MFKRRQYRRRPRRGVRKGGRFMNRKMRPTRALYHAPKHFTEVIKVNDIVSPPSGSAPGDIGFSVTGNAISNLRAALYDVFEQFTILAVKFMYIPAYNTYPLIAGQAMIPRLYVAENKNAQTPAALTISDMLQQDNVRILDSSKRWSLYVKNPRPYLEQFNVFSGTGAHTPVAPPAKQIQWLDTTPDTGTGESGLLVEWLSAVGKAEANNSAVAVTTGTLWARVYYAVKEQR